MEKDKRNFDPQAENPQAPTEEKATTIGSSSPATDANPTSNSRASETLTGFELMSVLISVTLAAFLMMLDLSVIVTAIPEITTHFHSTADIGWYGSAYLLSNCAIQPLSGKIYKHFNSKTVFISFLAVFELGSLICGVATSSTMLIIGRALAGMGGAGLVNGALTILSNCVPLAKRALVIGIMSGCANIANVLGPFVGGALTQYASWRWCFYINLPCGLFVAILLFIITIPRGLIPPARLSTPIEIFTTLDITGFLVFTPAIIMFLLALSWGGSIYSWSSPTILGLFVGSAPIFLAFLVWEKYKGHEAMLPLSMFKNKIVVFATLVYFFASGALMITIFYMPVWFQAVQGRTPTISGASLLPMVGAQIFTAVLGGYLVSRIGYYLPFGVLGLGVAAIGTGLLTTLLPDSSVAQWVGYEILTGIRGMALQIPLVAIQNSLRPENIALGNSLLIFLQNFGGTLSLSFAELIFTSSLKSNLKRYASNYDSKQILEWGATGFRDHVEQGELKGVLMAYNNAVVNTLYLSLGAGLVAWLCVWGVGFGSVREKKKVESSGEESAKVDEKK